MADAGEAEHQPWRLAGAGQAARPGQGTLLVAPHRSFAGAAGLGEQGRPVQRRRGLDQQIGIAAIAVAQAEAAARRRRPAEARRRGAHCGLGLDKDRRLIGQEPMQKEAGQADARRTMAPGEHAGGPSVRTPWHEVAKIGPVALVGLEMRALIGQRRQRRCGERRPSARCPERGERAGDARAAMRVAEQMRCPRRRPRAERVP